MHGSEKWQWSRSVVSDSWQPHGLQPIRLLHPWDFPGKSTGVGCHWVCLMRRAFVFVFWGCLNKWPQTDWSLFLCCSGRQKSKIKVSVGPCPTEGSQGGPFLALPASGASKRSWVCACITPVSASLLQGSPLCFSSSYASSLCPVGMVVIGFRIHPVNPGWSPHLKVLNYTCKDPFLKQVSIHRYLNSGCEHTFLGTTIQTTAVFFIFAHQRR